jgi:hypothetical protein
MEFELFRYSIGVKGLLVSKQVFDVTACWELKSEYFPAVKQIFF